MSAVEECGAESPLCSFPAFALRSLADDAEDPRELTVYPADAPDEALATTWLTVDVGAVVPPDEAR